MIRKIFFILVLICLPFFLFSKTISLSGDKWILRENGKEEFTPVTVPGNVYNDLFKAGKISSPHSGFSEEKLKWVSEKTWIYEREFEIDSKTLRLNNVDLVFDGLDTYCTLFINEKFVAQTDNMFRTWRFDCKKFLKKGANRLQVVFSPVMEVAGKIYDGRPYPLPAGSDASEKKVSNYVRKAPYHFGWDWGPRFLGVGIWRDVSLEFWSGFRLIDEHIRLLSVNAGAARLEARLEYFSEFKGNHKCQILADEGMVLDSVIHVGEGHRQAAIQFTIKNPELWWPNGYGEPKCYDLTLKLISNNGTIFRRKKIGLRTVELVNEKDESGTSFYFRVNGVPIFMKGANYVPPNPFNVRDQAARGRIFRAMQDAHFNMVRVWGGGVYEDDEFYDWCDSLGIMVWQDFMFACSMYPGDDQFTENVRLEVMDNVRRLRNHPSLALWCGNNEIDVAWKNWGWQEEFGWSQAQKDEIRGIYERFFNKLIPRIIEKYDPGRPYISTSPLSNWGTPENFNHHNMHYWGVWHGEDKFEEFRNNVPRFMTEYGFQSFPSVALLRKYSSGNNMGLDTKWIKSRQKSYKGNGLITDYMKRWYIVPEDFESYCLVSQLLQAEGLKIAIESHRLRQPHCMGTLYWQLNDTWAGPSWSGMDFDGNYKALQFWLKSLYHPVLPIAEIYGNKITVSIVNDLLEMKNAKLEVKVLSFSGDQVFSKEVDLKLGKSSVTKLFPFELDQLKDNEFRKGHMLLLSVSENGQTVNRNIYFFEKPRDLSLPESDYSYSIDEEKSMVIIKANTFLKNVIITAPDLEGNFGDNYFDMLPGETREIKLPDGGGQKPVEKGSIRVRTLLDLAG